MKQRIRLTESQLHRVIKESVKRVLRESNELDDFEETAYDCNGVEIHEGDIVVWTDPDGDRKVKYEVFGTPNSEMVQLWSKYGECEAFPHKCKVIRHRN